MINKVKPVSDGYQYPKSTSGKKAGKTIATLGYLAALPSQYVLNRLMTDKIIDKMAKAEPKLEKMMPDSLRGGFPKAFVFGAVIGLLMFRAIGGAIGKHYDKKQDAKLNALS